MVPECDDMIKCEKEIPSKEELWDKYYMVDHKIPKKLVLTLAGFGRWKWLYCLGF